MKYKLSDIHEIVGDFQRSNKPEDRYASFDYCYNYFKGNSGAFLLENMERSCMTLGFYLASWGMLRGSSFLLSKSAKHYQPLVEYIARLDRSVWEIDADNLRKNIPIVLMIYSEVQKLTIHSKNSHATLVTKIILGVFGFIPAFDLYFCNTFRKIFGASHGFRSINKKSLEAICDFYDHNRDEIDSVSETIFTMDFASGRYSIHHYPKAKIIDMYGFNKGLRAAQRGTPS